MFEVLCQKNRAGHGEIFFHGAICFYDGTTFKILGEDIKTFGRSLMKPFQIQMFKEELSDLTSEQLAISVASHNGTREHIEMAKSVLSGIDEEKLEISVSMPLEPGEPESSWANPCSGKHSAILKGLTRKDIDTKGYTKKDHPYDMMFKAALEKHCNTKLQTRAIDGCSLPTYLQSLSSIAKGFYNVASKDEFTWIRNSMKSHPILVGGKDRIDTEVMSIEGVDVLAKEGADGLFVVAFKHNDRNLCICLKMAQGRSPEAMKFITQKILERLAIKYIYKSSENYEIGVDLHKFLDEIL